MSSSNILSGDVGATKTRLGLFRPMGDRLELLREATYASAEHPSLAPLVRRFLQPGEASQITAAGFGVAGPVAGNAVRATNLPWSLHGDALAAELGVPSVILVNDLVALAEGVLRLADTDLLTLQAGKPAADGNRVLLAVGTGLGMALLPWNGADAGALYRVAASEGGHADFAPRNPDEIGLLTFLRERLGGRVSVERVVSGPGLRHLYDELVARRFAPEDPELAQAIASGDAAQVIAEAGLSGRSPLCTEVLRRFASAYGAVAGNLALTGLARGGVYLGGGVTPKLLPCLSDGTFLAAFHDKGRFRPLLEQVPVWVVTDPGVAVRGAAWCAVRQTT